jgi:hypothetical protein
MIKSEAIPTKKVRGAKVNCTCKNCGQDFEARAADVKRGWGLFCTKSCKAQEQEKRTGQYQLFLNSSRRRAEEEYGECEDPSWDAHKLSF